MLIPKKEINSLLLFALITVFKSDFSNATSVVHVGLASNFTEVSSGYVNPYGGYFRDAVQLAFEDSKDLLRKNGIEVVLEEFDYGNQDSKVLLAAKKAAASPVVAVIGYNYSTQALIAAPYHHSVGLPMITPSATANRVSKMGKFVHQACVGNSFIGEAIAQAAWGRLKAKRAVIVPAADCAYCMDLSQAFEKQFTQLGGVVTEKIPILGDDRNFEALVGRLSANKPDVVFVPNQELTSARIISTLHKASIDLPFLGGDWWGNVGKGFFEVLGNAPVEGYFISHWNQKSSNRESLNFIKKYQEKFGKTPVDTSALGYDAARILIEALLHASALTRLGIEDYLNQMRSFQGLAGEFKFQPGEAPKKSIVMMHASKQKFEMVDLIHPSL